MKFDDLQSGERLFLDANIFVYHFLGISTECRQLLSRCHQGDLTGITATFVARCRNAGVEPAKAGDA